MEFLGYDLGITAVGLAVALVHFGGAASIAKVDILLVVFGKLLVQLSLLFTFESRKEHISRITIVCESISHVILREHVLEESKEHQKEEHEEDDENRDPKSVLGDGCSSNVEVLPDNVGWLRDIFNPKFRIKNRQLASPHRPNEIWIVSKIRFQSLICFITFEGDKCRDRPLKLRLFQLLVLRYPILNFGLNFFDFVKVARG